MVKPALDRKFDRNGDRLQCTITDVGRQDPALQATGRTATNSHGQSMPNPPFGSSEFLLRTPPELKQGYQRLEVFSSCPVYSNPYSNAATALQPIDQRNKAPVAMQNRNRVKASCGLSPTYGAWKKHKITPHLPITCVKRIDGTHQPLQKSGSLFGIPNNLLDPPDCSSTATSSLSLFVLETFLALTAICQQILLIFGILLFRNPF